MSPVSPVTPAPGVQCLVIRCLVIRCLCLDLPCHQGLTPLLLPVLIFLTIP